MSLPYDVARCAGVGEDGDWRDGCSDCQRRTDRPDALVSMMPPPELIVFECAFRIEPECATCNDQGRVKVGWHPVAGSTYKIRVDDAPCPECQPPR